MALVVDLHEDDLYVRMRIAARLRCFRMDAGLAQHEVSGTHHLESCLNWKAPTLMHWARLFGHRIRFHPEGIPIPQGTDALDHILSSVRPKTPGAEDMFHLAETHGVLRRSRRSSGLSRTEVATRWRVKSPAAIERWERGTADGIMVASLQRAARALGGVLCIEIEKVPVHE